MSGRENMRVQPLARLLVIQNLASGMNVSNETTDHIKFRADIRYVVINQITAKKVRVPM